jgi:hypothetical protein
MRDCCIQDNAVKKEDGCRYDYICCECVHTCCF